MDIKKTMRCLLFSTCLILISCNTHQSIDGYYNHLGITSIKINGDRAILKYEDPREIFSGEILAECKIKSMGNGFYSLCSTDIPWIAFKDTTIQRIERTSNDPPTITFKFPNYKNIKTNPFKIIIDPWGCRELNFICDSNDFTIQMPDNPDWHMRDIDICIAPTEYISLTPFDYSYKGLLEYGDHFNRHNVRKHNLILTFPNVTNNLFLRKFFDHVIIKITDDYLILYGDKYIKE